MYKPKEFAKKIGVSVSTLRRWDKEKRLVPLRTKTNHRVYTDDDIFKVLNLEKPSNQGKIVVYCRVSSHAQKDDLHALDLIILNTWQTAITVKSLLPTKKNHHHSKSWLKTCLLLFIALVADCMDLKNTKSKSNRWLKKTHDIRTHNRTCSQ